MNIKQVKIGETYYTLKDLVARGGTVDGTEITSIEIDGVLYDCIDAVARGEMEPTANEVCKFTIGGKDYYIKDETARAKVEYFAVYYEDDVILAFYGDKTVPSVGERYKGAYVTAVYTGVENTGTSNPPWYSDRTKFQAVEFDASFADARPTSCYMWFYGFSNCGAIEGLKYLDTSAVTTMYEMFQDCSQLTSLDVSNWDTSAVTTMYWMFRDCSSLTTLDVSNWDTSAVTTMYWMFYNCSSLTTLDVSNWDTSAVTTMQQMFNNCSSLTALDVSNWDTSSVTNMGTMFSDCSSLTVLDVSNWDTSSVTNMGMMFAYCDSLTTIYSDDANFVTTAVTSSTNMFASCLKLVGGNGTKYNGNNITHTMAHIDTADNPGYFTGK